MMANEDVKNAVTELSDADVEWMITNFNNRDQVFTFIDADTGDAIHVSITRLGEGLDQRRIGGTEFRFMALTEQLYTLILEKQGVERQHVETVSPDVAAYDPALVLEDGDTHIIVDGNHKIVKAYEMGLRRRPAIFIPYSEIGPYLYTVPEGVSKVMQACTKNNVQFAAEVVKGLLERRSFTSTH